MDGGEFWHVAGSSGHVTMLRRNAVALRFRPIAPKPVVGGASSGGISPEQATVLLSTSKRVKRKYVRVRKDDNNPRRKRSNGKGLNSVKKTVKLTAGESPENSSGSRAEEGVVESWVTVEHVTDTCMEEVVGLEGCTDAERVKSLETDTCPGFVSDGSLSKVQWVNEAYRRMVAASHGGGGRRPEIAVRLVKRSSNNGTHCQLGGCTDGVLFFSCRVRWWVCMEARYQGCSKLGTLIDISANIMTVQSATLPTCARGVGVEMFVTLFLGPLVGALAKLHVVCLSQKRHVVYEA